MIVRGVGELGPMFSWLQIGVDGAIFMSVDEAKRSFNDEVGARQNVSS